jgi:hypothetical protein
MKLSNHKAWAKVFIQLTRSNKPSIAKLRSLERRVQKIATTSIGRWHAEQVAGFIAMTLEESGDKPAAVRTLLALFREHHNEMMYQVRAAREKATSAVELLKSLGKERETQRLRKDIAELDRFIASRVRWIKRSK